MTGVIQFLKRLFGASENTPISHVIEVRSTDTAQTAVVFVHGFGGTASATWGQFPALLAAHASLARWDIYSIGYASNLRVDVPHIWSADPPLELVSLSLRTALAVAPLNRYRAVALVAHSMGGLAAQHAMLDPDMAGRVANLILFGTPSAGLGKALLVGRLKRQLRDMEAGGEFVTKLRSDWNARYSANRPFALRVVAGERDEFVPGTSSLGPFPPDVQRAVPGNHLSIVKPESATDRSVQIVIESLCGSHMAIGNLDSAAIAVERSDFAAAARILLPLVAEIDDGALTQLALALEGLGRSQEALEVMEARFRDRGLPSTDAYGVLAGRIKRRWLVERRENDWARSRRLYEQALLASDPGFAGRNGEESVRPVDPDQAMYHAINIAFLDLMRSNPGTNTLRSVREMALLAKCYAEVGQNRLWCSAVLGDACSILGDLDAACGHYQDACALQPRPRDLQSMYSQALRIAAHVFGRRAIDAIERAFSVGTA